VELKAMRRAYRIIENDSLDENHFPVIAVFNEIANEYFVETISSLAEGIGFGVNYGRCFFKRDFEESGISIDENFDGVEFGLHNGEEIVVDYKTLFYYLNLACKSHIEDFPQDREEVEKILRKVKERFNL